MFVGFAIIRYLRKLKEMATDTPFERLNNADRIFLRERRRRIENYIKSVYDEISGERILDVAMGKWSLVKDIFPKLSVVGIDHKRPLLLPDDFCLVDCETELPFKDAEFSLAFAGEIIEHLIFSSAQNLLKAISRVLRPDGYLLLTTPNGFRNTFKNILKRPTIAAHEKEFSFREIKKLLANTGFKVIHSDGIQPVFVPWGVTTRFTSLKLQGFLSSQVIFFCQKI